MFQRFKHLHWSKFVTKGTSLETPFKIKRCTGLVLTDLATWGPYKLWSAVNQLKHTAIKLKHRQAKTERKNKTKHKVCESFFFHFFSKTLHFLSAFTVSPSPSPFASMKHWAKSFGVRLLSEFSSCSSLIGYRRLLPFLHRLTAEATVHRGVWLDGETDRRWMTGDTRTFKYLNLISLIYVDMKLMTSITQLDINNTVRKIYLPNNIIKQLFPIVYFLPHINIITSISFQLRIDFNWLETKGRFTQTHLGLAWLALPQPNSPLYCCLHWLGYHENMGGVSE